MGEYAGITSKRMYRVVKWLGKHKAVDVVVGGNHPIKVTAHKTNESYPLPISHKIVNKHIVKDFVEWLVRNEVCTKKEFDEKL